jgi:hypothetical protein
MDNLPRPTNVPSSGSKPPSIKVPVPAGFPIPSTRRNQGSGNPDHVHIKPLPCPTQRPG